MGAETFIRIGTCGGFQEDIAVGDIAIFDSAMRLDGASRLYAPPEYPAAAHHEVVNACIDAARELGFPYHVGTTRSADTFYASHPQPGSSFNSFWQSHWKEHFQDLKRLNIIAAEMEASIIFVLARVWGLRAGGISVVIDNVLKIAEEQQHFDPENLFEHGSKNIEKVARIGNEAVRLLYERDQILARV